MLLAPCFDVIKAALVNALPLGMQRVPHRRQAMRKLPQHHEAARGLSFIGCQIPGHSIGELRPPCLDLCSIDCGLRLPLGYGSRCRENVAGVVGLDRDSPDEIPNRHQCSRFPGPLARQTLGADRYHKQQPRSEVTMEPRNWNIKRGLSRTRRRTRFERDGG